MDDGWDLDSVDTKNWGSHTVMRPAGMDDATWYAAARSKNPAAAIAAWKGSKGGQVGVIGTSDIAGLLKQYDKSQADVKGANEARYQQILKGYQQRQGRVMDYAKQFGQAETENIQRGLTQNLASNEQSAISRGLGNTTVLNSLNRGSRLDAGYQQRQLGGQIANLKAQLDSQASGDQLAFMERRTDTGPSLGEMTNLMLALGQSGYQPRA